MATLELTADALEAEFYKECQYIGQWAVDLSQMSNIVQICLQDRLSVVSRPESV